jgi:hypothetical protein
MSDLSPKVIWTMSRLLAYLFNAYIIDSKVYYDLTVWHNSYLKPVSQIHQFCVRLGYDALTVCFLVISVGGRTAPLLLQYCSSSFFQAAGAPFKAPASFNFSLKFSQCGRRAVKKNASQSSRTVAVRCLNWNCSAILQCQ